MPRCPGRSHRPLVHALLQHASSTQKPVEHCDGVVHAPPWGTGVLVGVAVGVSVAVGVLVGVSVGVWVGGIGGSIDLQASKTGPTPQVAPTLPKLPPHPKKKH